MREQPRISPELVVRGACMGAFPMADGRRGRVQWLSPDPRAVLPLRWEGENQDGGGRGGRGETGPRPAPLTAQPGGGSAWGGGEGVFHVPKSLAKRVRSGRFRVTMDRAFASVIRACAEPRWEEAETWINDEVVATYEQLHASGWTHSVEAWRDQGEGEALVGGLYGLAVGGAFFGESMFSREADASKVCLVRLVEHLRSRGFELLDVQFWTPHLARFGCYELPRETYLRRLRSAVGRRVEW